MSFTHYAVIIILFSLSIINFLNSWLAYSVVSQFEEDKWMSKNQVVSSIKIEGRKRINKVNEEWRINQVREVKRGKRTGCHVWSKWASLG